MMLAAKLPSHVLMLSLGYLSIISICSAADVRITQPSTDDDNDLITTSTDILLNTTSMSPADVHTVDTADFASNSTLADLAARLGPFNTSSQDALADDIGADADPRTWTPDHHHRNDSSSDAVGNLSSGGNPGPRTPLDPRKKVLRCFKESDPRVNPTTLEACKFSQDLLLRYDLTEHEISPTAWQRWHYEPAPKGYHEVPEMYVALHPQKDPLDYSCRIIVSTHKYSETDTFRTVDVATGVQKLMDNCLSPSKGGWGGLVSIGHTGSFFVAIDGYAPPRTTTSFGQLIAEKTAVPAIS